MTLLHPHSPYPTPPRYPPRPSLPSFLIPSFPTPPAQELTSQPPTLLQMIDPLAPIAFTQLLAHESRHHRFDPLFADDGVLGLFEAGGVVVVDVVERGGDGGFAGEEGGGFGGGHFGFGGVGWGGEGLGGGRG